MKVFKYTYGFFFIVLAMFFTTSLSLGQLHLSKAFLQYDHTLVGGDIEAGAFVQIVPSFVLSGYVGTQQTFEGWQGFSGLVRSDFSLLDLPLRFTPRGFTWLGGKYETVNIAGRAPSPNLLQFGSSFSRFVPAFGVGVGIDSLEFICENCPYYIWAEASVGDFVSQRISFIRSSPTETLSLSVLLSAKASTPYGSAVMRRQMRIREWFGDNIWQLEYETPSLCYDMLKFGVGWETGYLGFANVEFTVLPIVLYLSALVPKDASLWRWSVGVGFIPSPPFSTRCRSCTRVQIPWN